MNREQEIGGQNAYAIYDREGVRVWFSSAEEADTVGDILSWALNNMGYSAFEWEEEHVLAAYAVPGEVETREVSAFLQGVGSITHWEYFQVEGKNWNTLWESHYPPMRLDVAGCSLAVVAPFHGEEARRGADVTLVLQPRMAFGTGHHATTQLMLRGLLTLQVAGCWCLDMGCGSGVLGILSLLRGAGRCVAVDIDPVAVVNARENAHLNRVPLEVIEGGFEVLLAYAGCFHVICCNTTLNTLTEGARALCASMAEGGHLLVSGFYEKESAQVEALFSVYGLGAYRKQVGDDGWCMLAFRALQGMESLGEADN